VKNGSPTATLLAIAMRLSSSELADVRFWQILL
jgi:hypothetical protein